MRNPFVITEPTVISFSGGRTSAYMLWRVLEVNGGKMPDECIAVFANTGKEMEETLEFVRDCSINWGVDIKWVERDFDNEKGYRLVNFDTASRKGEPFEALVRKRNYLPNPVARICTAELKIKAQAKYLADIDFYDGIKYGAIENLSWVGLRKDETRRAAKMDKSRVPLWVAGVTKTDVGNFWKASSFDLGLPNNNGVTMHGNCDLCFLKSANQVLSLIREKPSRATWWIKIESLALASKPSGARFRNDRPSYKQMLEFSQDQSEMFGYDDEDAIACFCGD